MNFYTWDGQEITLEAPSITASKSGSTTTIYSDETEIAQIQDGTPGTTPVKGTDYWTSQDKSSMISDVMSSQDMTNIKNAFTAGYGAPLVASNTSGMTDHSKIYVYTGSQSGYTSGHWYYWNGSAWTDGGVYNSVAVNTDKTLSIQDMAADAAAVGSLKDALNEITDEFQHFELRTDNALSEILIENNGGNLLPIIDNLTVSDVGVTIDNNGDGTYTLNGTCTGNKTIELTDKTWSYATLVSGTPYKYILKAIGGTATGTAVTLYLGTSSSSAKLSRTPVQVSNVYTPSQNEDFVRYGISVTSGSIFTNYILVPYLCMATDYQNAYVGNQNILHSDLITSIDTDLDAVKNGYEFFDYSLFVHGFVANATGALAETDDNIYTIAMKNVQCADRDIHVVGLDSDYNIWYYTYTSYAGSSTGHTYAKKTEPFIIPKGTYFRLTISPKTHESGYIANIILMSKKVYFKTVVADEVDELNALLPVKSVVNIDTVYITNVQQRIYFNELFHVQSGGYYVVSVTGATYPEVTYTDRYIEFNVTTTKSISVTIKYYLNDTVCVEKILAVECNVTALPSKKYMFIGDSYTASGYMQNWFYDNNSGAVTLYGTIGSAPYLQEGRSGWSADDYFTSGKSGITNPFYNPSTQTFDFSYYITNNPSFSDVDVVNILLGRNNAWSTTVLEKIEDMVDSILDYNSNIIVTIMCASNVACNNTGMGKYLQNVYRDMINKQNYNIALSGYFDEYQNVLIVWQNLNLDNVYDFAMEEVDSSIVNSEKVKMYVDNVHPSQSGYKKFGIAYNGLMHNLLNE